MLVLCYSYVIRISVLTFRCRNFFKRAFSLRISLLRVYTLTPSNKLTTKTQKRDSSACKEESPLCQRN